MRNHIGKLLFLAAAASLTIAGCGGSSSSPAAPGVGVNAPAGIIVTAIDDGEPNNAPGTFALPAAINDINQIVGTAEGVAGGILKPALWLVDDEGSATVAPSALATIANGFAAANNLNSAGVIVGMAANVDSSIRAVVWADKDSAPALLQGLAAGGFAAAYGINDSGSIVGSAENSAGLLRAVRWQRSDEGALTGPFTLPGVPAGWEAEAYAVNAENHVVGEMIDAEGIAQAVLWRWTPPAGDIPGNYAPVFLGMGNLTGFDHAMALDLASGEPLVVVGEVADDGNGGLSQAVRWVVDGTTVTFTNLGAADRSSSAAAVNTAGRVAGWESNASAVSLATVWNKTPGKTALLNTSSQAFGINDNNLVVGRSGSAGFVKKVN